MANLGRSLIKGAQQALAYVKGKKKDAKTHKIKLFKSNRNFKK